MGIQVHELSGSPTAAWEAISKTQQVIKMIMDPLNPEVPENKVRVVCMSDTHSLTSEIKFEVPDGDIFIHAGDFTRRGRLDEVIKFNNWIADLPHKYKIVIAGNHELSFDEACTHPLKSNFLIDPMHPDDVSTLENSKECLKPSKYLTNCTYLEDEPIEIYGLKMYGTPWQPEFGNWAFNMRRGQACLDKWNEIPTDLDILITHGPPIGHGDLCCNGKRAGCVELLASIQQRIKPKYHVFGHIHEGYGITSDGKITFINASTCNSKYLPINPPIVFDVPLHLGKTKE